MMRSEDFLVPVTEPFTFDWPVDQSGYDLVEEPDTGADGATILSGAVGPELRRKGGPLRYYRPFDDAPGLFLQLAHTEPAPGAILAFINHFGFLGFAFLGDPGTQEKEPLSDWMRMIQQLRSLENQLVAYRTGTIEDPDMWLQNIGAIVQPRLVAHLSLSEKRKPTITASPLTLRGALWLQFLSQITEGRNFKQCEQCETWFPYGAGTGNRSRKRFCTDRCRVAWHRKRNEARS